MRAVVYRDMGPAEAVLHVEDVDTPQPAPGQVRVRVHTSGINPTDYKARSGAVPRSIDGFQIPHQDGAGVIDAVGDGVDPARIGERVWLWFAATSRWGTAADYSVVPADQAVRLPEGASFDLGASLGVPAMTAHRCLFADGPVTGKSVLVAGGAGAVGHAAIELAKHAGARVVATVSSEEKADLARRAGADHVVNYRDGEAAERIRAFAARIDRIVEVAPAANLDLDLSLATPETVVVSYAADGNDPVLPLRRCMTANVTLRFVLLYGVPRPALRQACDDITVAIEAGALTPLPIHRFGLDEAAAAQRSAENGAVGKVVLAVTTT